MGKLIVLMQTTLDGRIRTSLNGKCQREPAPPTKSASPLGERRGECQDESDAHGLMLAA